MAEDTRIVGIYEIKIEQGPALRAFEEVKKKLDTTRASIKELNKENKELIAAEREIEAAVKATGVASTAQAKQLEAVRARRDELNKELSEAVIVEKALSSQSRELTNDLSGLTENNLRFRDKMAQATLEAIKQSGVVEQLGDRQKELAASLSSVERNLKSSEDQLSQLNVAYSKNEISAEKYADEQAQLNRQIEDGKAANTLLKAELEKVSATTATLDQRIHDLNVELNAGKINTEQYRLALSRIEDETRKAGAATGELTSRFDRFVGGQGAELKSTLTGIANNYIGIGAAVYGAQKLIGDAIDTVVEFDRKLAGIRALGGEYAANIDAIGEAAKTAGINFGLSAGESLDAVEALAKAGVSTADILGGALPGALTLAAAGEVSVAEAAETASKAMTQFGLSGEQIPQLADLLAAAAATATGDVTDFNAALNQSGLVAAQLGIPIEEAVGSLTAFASAGLLGSDAGTSFRTMLLRLQNPTEESAALMEQLGLNAFDAKGDFVGLESLAGQLQDRLSGLTQEQRSAALAQIFGSDAIRAANVLYTQGADGIEKFTEQVNKQGFAAQVAGDKTDNLGGDISKLKATYDALILSVESGDGVLSNAFRTATQSLTEYLGVLTDAADSSNSFFERTASLVASGAGLGAGAARSLVSNLFFTDEELRAAERGKQGPAQQTPLKDQSDAQIRKRIEALKEEQELLRGQGLEGVAKGFDRQVVALERLLTERAKLNAAQKEGTELTEANTEATDRNTKATQKDAEAKTNAAGSVADLNSQISTLREQQAQSTSSAQFQAYEDQIAALNDQLDTLTSKIVAVPDLKDIEFAQLSDDGPAPSTPSTDDLAALGINPNAKELIGAEMAEIQGLIDSANLQRLESSMALSDQLLALDQQWANGSIKTLKEYEAKRGEIEKTIGERERAAGEASVEIAQGAFEALQAISDASFDSQISELDSQSAALQEKLSEATSEDERRRIESQIKQNEAQKKGLEEQKKNQKAFALAAALIATYQAAQQAYLSQLTIPTPDAPIRAAAAAGIATALGLLNVAKIAGFAEGGRVEPSGMVTQQWGTPVTRSNGDNVLVRAGRSFVTLKTGEVVLNDDQQREAKKQFGSDVFARIGVPGFGGKTMAQHYMTLGYADGGTVSLITPRPTPSTLVQSTLVSELANYADRPIQASIVEIRDVDNRMSIIEEARST